MISLYFLVFVLVFALVSTAALWVRLYNINRNQGLFTFFLYFPALPLLAWTHKEKCKNYLLVWLVSMALVVGSVIWVYVVK